MGDALQAVTKGRSVPGSGAWPERLAQKSSSRHLMTRGSGTACRVAFAMLTLFTLSACGNIEPWVKPYERQNLADPVMSFDLNPVSSSYMGHVYEAREGARGALGGSGGGCGCN